MGRNFWYRPTKPPPLRVHMQFQHFVNLCHAHDSWKVMSLTCNALSSYRPIKLVHGLKCRRSPSAAQPLHLGRLRRKPKSHLDSFSSGCHQQVLAHELSFSPPTLAHEQAESNIEAAHSPWLTYSGLCRRSLGTSLFQFSHDEASRSPRRSPSKILSAIIHKH